MKPASRSRPAVSAATRSVVSAEAPRQRGCETIATRPPGRSAPRRSFSRAFGSGHIPKLLTASTLVEHVAEITEIQGGFDSQVDSTLLHSSPVADGRLAHHDLGVVDSEHETVGCATGQLANRESRAEANLQDVVLRLNVQQSDRPTVPLSIRWP